jgi:hypothetical protein
VLVLTGLTDSGKHEWKNEAAHKYAPSDIFNFVWKPGDAIALSLDGPRSWLWLGYYRAALIPGIPFEGPLAIWKLHRAGKIGEGSAMLSFDIVDCPGPPRTWGVNSKRDSRAGAAAGPITQTSGGK